MRTQWKHRAFGILATGILLAGCPALPPQSVAPPIVGVAGGWFQMGAADVLNDAGTAQSSPPRFVQLDAYCIGKYETANAEYAKVLNWAYQQGLLSNEDGSSYSGGDVYAGGSLKRIYKASQADAQLLFVNNEFLVRVRENVNMNDFPVVHVTWYGAAAYCNWLSEMEGLDACYDLSTWEPITPWPHGYRLPTEAEWERAAGWDTRLDSVALPDGGSGGAWKYACSSDTISFGRVNYYDLITGYNNPLAFTEFPYLTPRGYFRCASPVGVHDMSGNVWEWCQDWYEEPPTGDANPMGPATGELRVLRGGCWGGSWQQPGTDFCRTAYRTNGHPDAGNHAVGFRVARSAPE